MRIIGKLREILREVAELGVEVKAADGLVDFRSKLHGRTVLLCWLEGEPELDAGLDLPVAAVREEVAKPEFLEV